MLFVLQEHNTGEYLKFFSNIIESLFNLSIYLRVQTLGKLVESVRPLVQQLDMIGSICKVRQDPQGWVQLPTGIELLSLLLQVSVHVCQVNYTSHTSGDG